MTSRKHSYWLPQLLAPFALLASCDSGANVSGAFLAEDPPPSGEVTVDLRLRRDLSLGNGLLGDMLLQDMNGDGVLDLVVSELPERRVLVGYGDGSGEYDLVASLPVPAGPLNLASGDYDGNGLTDVAAVCSVENGMGGTPSVVVLLQTELGVWDNELIAPLEFANDPFDVVTAVMRPGGGDDLLVTVPRSRQTYWISLKGLELGIERAFSSANGKDQGGEPLTVAAYDVNLDGREDLVVGEFFEEGAATGRVISFGNLPDLGDGEPGIVLDDPFVVLGTGFADPIVRVTGDLDGDGRGELAVAEFAGTAVTFYTDELLEGGASGAFTRRVELGAGVSSVLVDDIDGDGTADLAATLAREGAVVVCYGEGEGLSDMRSYNVGTVPRAIASGDLQGDMLTDLVCCNVTDISCIFGSGGRSLRAASGVALAGPPEVLLCADFDGDGRNDVAVIDNFQSEIEFLSGDEGGLTRVGSVPLNSGGDQTPGYMIAEDFDGDGDLDLLASLYDGNALALLSNTGALPLMAPEGDALIPVGRRPIGLDAALIDDDELLDVVVANFGDRTLQFLSGNGDGTFEAGEPFPVEGPPLALTLRDFDGDDVLDVAVSTGAKISAEPDAFVLVYRGNGDGTFDAEPVSSTLLGARATVLVAEDFNGDGMPELVASQPSDISESIYFLTNNGSFDFSAETLPVGSNPGALSLGDINNDLNPDILVPLGAGELRVLAGDGMGGFTNPLTGDARRLSVPFLTSWVGFCDVTGSSLPDLLVVSPASSFVWVAEHLGVPLAQ